MLNKDSISMKILAADSTVKIAYILKDVHLQLRADVLANAMELVRDQGCESFSSIGWRCIQMRGHEGDHKNNQTTWRDK